MDYEHNILEVKRLEDSIDEINMLREKGDVLLDCSGLVIDSWESLELLQRVVGFYDVEVINCPIFYYHLLSSCFLIQAYMKVRCFLVSLKDSVLSFILRSHME